MFDLFGIKALKNSFKLYEQAKEQEITLLKKIISDLEREVMEIEDVCDVIGKERNELREKLKEEIEKNDKLSSKAKEIDIPKKIKDKIEKREKDFERLMEYSFSIACQKDVFEE